MTREKPRRLLTPLKVVAVYAVALALVSIHEMDRLSAWVEESTRDWKQAESISSACQGARRLAENLGVGRVEAAEKYLLSLTQSLPSLGGTANEVPAALKNVGPAATEDSFPVPPYPVPAADPASLVVAERETSEPMSDIVAGDEENPSEPVPDAPKEEAPPDVPMDTEPSPTPAADPSPALPETAPATTKFKPKKILIAGDSMMLEGFGPALQRTLQKKYGFKVFREGKYSSGLSRPDFFDWNANLKEILDKHQPDLLVMSLGANDPQDILEPKTKRHIVATDTWNEIYAQRGRSLLAIPEQRGILTIWVGLPIMGNKANYNERIANLNRIMGDVCRENPRCEFIDSWYSLANEQNKYATFLKGEGGKTVRVRASDNIHLTDAGGQIMTDFFLRETGGFVDWSKVEPQSAESAAASADLAGVPKK